MNILSDILDVAIDAAYLAGKRTLTYYQSGVRTEYKADTSPVTIADRESERIIRERIKHSFPTHSILGEEEGEFKGNSSLRWIIDPLDGTKAFISGVPFYGVLVGVEIEGNPTVGVAYFPVLGELVTAVLGQGCRWNGRRCVCSSTNRLEDAVVVTSSITRCQARSDAFDKLAARTKWQRTWGDAYGYFLVATGQADIMIDAMIKPWDAAPMLPIIHEAGGHFTDWSGKRTILGRDAFATNNQLYGSVLQILQSENLRLADVQ